MEFLSWAKTRLSGRSDSEHEQAMLRLLLGLCTIAYLQHAAIQYPNVWLYASGAYVAVMVPSLVAGLIIIACILAWPQPSTTRRVIGNIVDVAVITFLMIHGGEYTAPFFGIYLWVTFGNGFRFGSRFLASSLALSTVGFVIVLATSDYWAQNRHLGVGLLIGMIALSLYVLMLIKRLYEALERAATANQAKRAFVSSVSHELRTPLNAIIGMNDLLRTTPLNAEQSEMTNTMHGASRVMLSLIEDVLDFSKIEAGKLTIESVDFDLHALIQSTVIIFSRQAAMKGLKLGVFVMPDVTPTLKGGAHHLQQILVNLIGNAVKFTERGEVHLAISALIDSQQSIRLRFAVRDTGIGIPKPDQQRIFESFSQAESPSDRKHRGTGLGTTIAKQLVELMGGTIGLESAPGAGSTFWFEVSFAKQSAASAESQARFRESRALLVQFPDKARKELAADLKQWEMESSVAESITVAAARLSEAAALGRPYRIVLIYADNTDLNIAHAASELREQNLKSLSLILCAPRHVALLWGTRLPGEFSSIVGLPAEKRLLYNALHSVLASEEMAAGVISLSEYYQRKEPTRSYSILVADDDHINRTVISKQLEMAGHRVKLVVDGEKALDELQQSDYDLVILDSHMPVMTGLEATRLIRVMQAGRAGVPIIMFSADATPETIEEALDAGVSLFLPKPLEASRLYAAIEQLVDKVAKDTSKVIQIFGGQQAARPPLVNINTLHDLERMSHDTQFVHNLVKLFVEDSFQLVVKIEKSLANRRQEEFRSHMHALKGSALNLGAERLFTHCSKLGATSNRQLDESSAALAAETRVIVTDTHAALSDYVKNRNKATL